MLKQLIEMNSIIRNNTLRKWDIEKIILALENDLLELEQLCLKPIAKDETNGCLDFTIKISDLERKITHLEKSSLKPNQDIIKYRAELKRIKDALHQYKVEYHNLIQELQLSAKKLEEFNINIRGKIHDLRIEINKLPDTNHRIDIISELSTFLTVKMLINIFEEIREINDSELFLLLQRVTGQDLKKNHSKNSFSEICKKLFHVDVEHTLESYIKSNDADGINEKSIQELIQKLTSDFWKSANKNFHINVATDADSIAQINTHIAVAIYLLLILNTFKYNDDIQMNIGMARYRFALLQNTREYINPFATISALAKFIQISPKTRNLFQEACVWLQGSYQNSTNQIPPFLKDNNGNITDQAYTYICDHEDRDLFKWKPPLTKLKIEKHGRTHVIALMKLLNPEQKEKLNDQAPQLNGDASSLIRLSFIGTNTRTAPLATDKSVPDAEKNMPLSNSLIQ